MAVFFDNCDVIIDGTGIVADSASISYQNTLRPLYMIGKRGNINISPNGPIKSNIRIDYYPQIAYDPNYNYSNTIKNLTNDINFSGVRIEIGGITGNNCYLDRFGFKASPNQLVRASVSYSCYTDLSGLIQNYRTGIVYKPSGDFWHGWTTYIISTTGFESIPTYDFDYEFNVNWQPTYVIGNKYPIQINYMNAEERMSFTRDKFYHVTFSGQDAYGTLVDLSQNDSNIDIMDIAFVCELHNKKTRFAAIGDYGWSGTNLSGVAKMIKNFNPEFIITLGDNNYDSGFTSTIDNNIGQYFSNYIYPYSGNYISGAIENKFYPSIGNHDATGNVVTSTYADNYRPYLDYFYLDNNERFYDFVKDDVHFIVLNSDKNEPSGYGVGSDQIRWAQNKLQNSSGIWRFVYFHHSPYCSESSYNSTWMNLHPWHIWGADVVAGGHGHIAEIIEKSGTTYIVNGIGGRSLRSIGTPVEGSLMRYSGDYGAFIVEAESTKIGFYLYDKNSALVTGYTKYKPISGFTNMCPLVNFDVSGAKITNCDLEAKVDDIVRTITTIEKYY